jgi:hypothetical protein
MRFGYARWQGFVAVAAGVAFIVATHWRYPGLAGGIMIGAVALLRLGEWAAGPFVRLSPKPDSRSRAS